ncbi:MAG: insulinase family protein [Oscillospiraceae bacterium]|nr:insulinase family protein [Oscillospiraceae bacterium]
MIGIEQRAVCNGVNFSSIRDERFKTIRMSVHFLWPLTKETVSANSILPFLLSRASRKYPDFTKLNAHLAELYGATLSVHVQKLGDVQVLSISASGIADRYTLKGEPVSAQLAKLLCSIIFDPPLENGCFSLEGFNQEKRQMLEMLDSEFNDKRLYAKLKCEQLMCAKEPYGLSRCGSRQQIKDLQLDALTPAWENLIHRAPVEIMVLGDCDPEPIYHDFYAAFHNLARTNPVLCPNTVIPSVQKMAETTEKMDVVQSKLVMGFRTACAEPSVEVPAMKLFNAIYGGTTSCKLFLNVREKLSLCYYCSSMFNPMKGIMLVQSGVETKNVDRAKQEILHQLEEVQNGSFDDNDLATAKLSLCNSYRTLSDSLDGLEAWYLSQTFRPAVKKPEEEAELVRNVTHEQVVEAARKVTLDTVYRLEGNGVKD